MTYRIWSRSETLLMIFFKPFLEAKQVLETPASGNSTASSITPPSLTTKAPKRVQMDDLS